MSVIFSSEHGWVVSHSDFIKKIYKTVENSTELSGYQLKHELFHINSPFLRYNEDVNKYNNPNLKKKRKIKITAKKCEELENMIQCVSTLYTEFIKVARSEEVFIKKLNYEQCNTNARLLATKCYEECNKNNFSGIGGNGDNNSMQTINEEIYLFPNNCRFFAKNINDMNNCLSEEKFDLILLDPPWWNKSIRRKRARNTDQSYEMMYNIDLTIIPIKNILAEGGLVVIWCTNSPQHFSDLIQKVLPFWEIEIVSIWYWLKVTQFGEPVCKFSQPFMKQPFEQIVLARRKSDPKVYIPNNKIIMSIPSAINSHKPPLIEVLKPYIGGKQKCLEIFARYLLPNWTSWGLEAIKFQHISLYEKMD